MHRGHLPGADYDKPTRTSLGRLSFNANERKKNLSVVSGKILSICIYFDKSNTLIDKFLHANFIKYKINLHSKTLYYVQIYIVMIAEFVYTFLFFTCARYKYRRKYCIAHNGGRINQKIIHLTDACKHDTSLQ